MEDKKAAITKLSDKTKVLKVYFIQKVLFAGTFTDVVEAGLGKTAITTTTHGLLVFHKDCNRFVPFANIREMHLEEV